jgi:hypothetical protein
MYKLFLDDLREIRNIYPNTTLSEWIVVRSYAEFVECINKNGLPIFCSFDHDLADEHYRPSMYNPDKHYSQYYSDGTFKEKTGYDCANFYVERCLEDGIDLPPYQVHSMNPVGAANIRALLESYSQSRSLRGHS